MQRLEIDRARQSWLIPMGLVALTLIPTLAGLTRLSELAGGPRSLPTDDRFFASPAPVVLHIVAVSLYGLLGALQFSPGLRRRYGAWHRASGVLLILCGLVTAATGLWMTQIYARLPTDSALLHTVRLAVGVGMIAALSLGVAALRRRDFPAHGVWMTRAYALALGAGTQVFTQAPWLILVGPLNPTSRAVTMTAGWLINIVVAELFIAARRRARSRRPNRK